MWCKELNTIFVHVPKTAGQSIEHVFLQELGLSWQQRSLLLLRPNKDPTLGPPRLAHLFAREYYECNHMSEEEFSRHFRFSVVRNPYDRVVSQYKFRYQPAGLSFPAFVEHLRADLSGRTEKPRHLAPQHDFLFSATGSLLMDVVIRFERLQEEVAPIFSRLFGQSVPLPVVNRSADRTPAREFYDDVTKRTVAGLYEADFDSFQYTF
jgi:hypothetical protein